MLEAENIPQRSLAEESLSPNTESAASMRERAAREIAFLAEVFGGTVTLLWVGALASNTTAHNAEGSLIAGAATGGVLFVDKVVFRSRPDRSGPKAK